MKNKLIQFLKNETFHQLIRKYWQEKQSESIRNSLNKFIETLNQEDCKISVLGSQGSGKSTFLNALLFDDTILPVDADETTCIPVEIRYSDEVQIQSTVYFKNGKSQNIPATEEGLKPFVHQESNPDNQKEVDRIVIHCKKKLLKKGLVFVDLPGVGSLSPNNAKTTYNYITESAAAIFLLRTNPPINQTDKNMIQLTWPLISKTFFVQNQWTDESSEEVEDGKSYNLDRLKDLAKICHLSDRDIEIYVVGAYDALIGKIRNDQQKVSKSKINAFLDKTVSFSEQWQQSIIENIKDNTKRIILDSIAVIQERERIKNMSCQDALKTINEKEQGFKKEFEENKRIADECLEFIYDEKDKIKDEIEKVVHLAYSQLRNNIREDIQNGLVSGEMLAKALKNHINEQNDYVFYEINPLITSLLEEVKKRISKLKEYSFEKGKFSKSYDFSDKTRIHSFYEPVGGLGGALIGGSYGAAFGPIGAIIGGVLGGLIGSFMGNRSKKIHLDQQKKDAWYEVEPYTDEFRTDIQKSYNDQLNRLYHDVKTSVKDWHKNNEKEFKDYLDMLKKDIQKTDQEKFDFIQTLNMDKSMLEKFLEVI
ncbi:MAG: dynamin family protein [Candidatus Cloacimonetes bacterium]|nr:dynamin family protein [Candidatus Cloacimonadota bacterium]